MMLGKDSKRRVCPVGAVSKITTEKFIFRTNLQNVTYQLWSNFHQHSQGLQNTDKILNTRINTKMNAKTKHFHFQKEDN